MLALNRDQRWPLTAWLAMIILRFLTVCLAGTWRREEARGGAIVLLFGQVLTLMGIAAPAANSRRVSSPPESVRQPIQPSHADLPAQPQMHPLPMSAWAPDATPLSRRSKRARPPSGYRNGACGAAGPSLSSSRPPPAAGLYRAGQRQARRAPHHGPCLAAAPYLRPQQLTDVGRNFVDSASADFPLSRGQPPARQLAWGARNRRHDVRLAFTRRRSATATGHLAEGQLSCTGGAGRIYRCGADGLAHVREPRPGGLSGHRRGYAR